MKTSVKYFGLVVGP